MYGINVISSLKAHYNGERIQMLHKKTFNISEGNQDIPELFSLGCVLWVYLGLSVFAFEATWKFGFGP